jgi:type IV pilus assembly protein PilC
MSVIFGYTARSGDGEFVAGTLLAENHAGALEHLRSRKLFVTSIGESGSVGGAFARLASFLPVSQSARTSFFRSFAALIAAGVPIRRSLEFVTANCRDGRLREALNAVANDIECGNSLSVAMSKRPAEFSRLMVAMIRAGELGGSLDEVLERLATVLERNDTIRKRVRASMTYPLVVAVASLALVLFLVGNTVPAFAAMFAQMHVPLPLVTRIVLTTGNALRRPVTWIAIAAAPAAMLLLRYSIRRSALVEEWCHRLVIALPVAGDILQKGIVARLARTLGTLLRSGVPLLEAIETAGSVVENASYARYVTDISSALREGSSIAEALEPTPLRDGIFLALVRVGEETGTLDAMLLRIAEYYELDTETAVSALGSVLEPVLILALGSVVGLIVASIMIPLYSMIGSIK